jgi:peptide/nickel transport system substrate-binding protein
VIRRQQRRWAIAGISAALVVAGTLVGVRLASGDAERGQAVVVWGASQPFPENFVPVISAGASLSTNQLLVQVLPAPFRLKPDMTVVADDELLTSEPTSNLVAGRQIVTFRLNRQARWSDGRQIDAGDFAFSWRIQRSADPARGGCPALLSTVGYDQIASVTGADSGRTVVVTFSRPFADWKALFAPVFPAHLMDSGDPVTNCVTLKRGWPAADGVPVSGGPWKIDRADVNPGKKAVSLTPNRTYWGHQPKIDRLIWQSFGSDGSAPDAGTVINALRAGEVDVADPPPQYDLVERLRALAPALVTQVTPGLTFDHLDFNVTNFHLGQKAVRQAIATALDRPTVVRSTVGQIDPGARMLNNRMYMTSQPEYMATNDGKYEHADVAAARRLLEGARYTMGADGVYVKDGRRLSLELMTTPGVPVRAAATQVIAAELRRAGFEITLFPNRRIFGDKHTATSLESGDFEMALYSWVGSPFITGNQNVYASPRGDSISQNYTRGADARVDELFGRLAIETDPAQSAAIANRIDRLLWDDLFTIPLFQRPVLEVHSRDLLNVSLNPANVGLGWNANDWVLRG